MKVTLVKPWAGWSNLKISDGEKEFSGRLSLIQSVPSIFLSKFNRFILGDDVVMQFDEEGTDFIVVMCQYDYLKVIVERQKSELIEFNIWSDEIIEPICNSIAENLDDWAWFDANDQTEFEENKKYILKNIEPILEWCKNRKQ